MDSPSQLHEHLHKLWEFLRRCSVQLSETAHTCCWVSAVFGEQDDDMMEAAKALFSIFRHHRYDTQASFHLFKSLMLQHIIYSWLQSDLNSCGAFKGQFTL